MHNRDAVFSTNSAPNYASDVGDNHYTHTPVKVAFIVVNLLNPSITFFPRPRRTEVTENCVPACLSCNGHKSDADVFDWYRRQRFYDPRRAMAIRAWMDGDLRLALRLLQWAHPRTHHCRAPMADLDRTINRPEDHQTRQASTE